MIEVAPGGAAPSSCLLFLCLLSLGKQACIGGQRAMHHSKTTRRGEERAPHAGLFMAQTVPRVPRAPPTSRDQWLCGPSIRYAYSYLQACTTTCTTKFSPTNWPRPAPKNATEQYPSGRGRRSDARHCHDTGVVDTLTRRSWWQLWWPRPPPLPDSNAVQ